MVMRSEVVMTCADVRSLYVYNKIDSISLDFLNQLAREPNTVVMSCELDLGIKEVVDRCWEELQLIRVYTKRSELSSLKEAFMLIKQTRRGPGFQRSLDRKEELDNRGCMRSDTSHVEGDVQICSRLGRKRQTHTTTSWTIASCG